MFASFKKLFRKDGGDLATSIPERFAASRHEVRAEIPFRPALTMPASLDAVDASAAAPLAASPEMVALPLRSVLARLPNSLSPIVQSVGNGSVLLPSKRILQELPKGVVKISFAELRAAAPAGTFFETDRHDQMLVELPLNEVLARLHPALLARRPAQKKIQLSEGVTNVFGPRGEGISVSAPPGPTKGAGAHAAQSTGDHVPSAELNRAVEAAPIAMPRFDKPLSTPVSAPSIFEIAAPSPFAPAVSAVPPLRVLPSPAESSHVGKFLEIELGALSENFPALIKSEIAASQLARVTVALPLALVEAALKTAKIVFTWRQLGEWMQPPLTALSETPLELPLHVVAPIFIAKHRAVKNQRKILVDEIPDLFAPKNGARIPTAMPPAAEIPAPPIATAPAPLAPFVAPKLETAPVISPTITPPKTIEPLFVAPVQKNLSPNEAVKTLAATPGALGAFVAMPDGLLVAAQLPENLKADTVAAFLPQIFGRMNQYTKELKLGPLSGLTFVVENVSWKIIKAGGIYLVVLAHSFEQLSDAHLNHIAAELGRQIQ